MFLLIYNKIKKRVKPKIKVYKKLNNGSAKMM